MSCSSSGLRSSLQTRKDLRGPRPETPGRWGHTVTGFVFLGRLSRCVDLRRVALFVPDCHLATDAFVHVLWECCYLVRKISLCMCQWRYLTTHLSLSCQCFLNLVLPSP